MELETFSGVVSIPYRKNRSSLIGVAMPGAGLGAAEKELKSG
jgi:hypothetical protein